MRGVGDISLEIDHFFSPSNLSLTVKNIYSPTASYKTRLFTKTFLLACLHPWPDSRMTGNGLWLCKGFLLQVICFF